MSLLDYFRRKDTTDQGIFLPAPKEGGPLPSHAVECANLCVADLGSEIEPRAKRRKTIQHAYSAETRAQIGNYASHNGPQAAVKHFPGICGHRVPESTLRKFRGAYLDELKRQSSFSSGPVWLVCRLNREGGH